MSSEVEKDLCVLVDTDLKFSKHVEEQVNKANRALGVIGRSFQFLNRESMKLLFTALVRPHLEIGYVVWAPRYQKDRLLIEGVLRRATKMVPGLRDLEYSERHKCMNLPNMKYRQERGDMSETYKYTHGLYSASNSLLERDAETRGHKYKLKKSRCYTSLRQYFFSFRAVDSWNSLPPDVVEAPSPQAFKNRMDSIWSERKFLS